VYLVLVVKIMVTVGILLLSLSFVSSFKSRRLFLETLPTTRRNIKQGGFRELSIIPSSVYHDLGLRPPSTEIGEIHGSERD
jgi:hypothetical protein